MEWIDSTRWNNGWNDETNIDFEHVETIGFLINETDDGILISHSVGNFGGEVQLHFDHFTIPKGCIVNRERLEI